MLNQILPMILDDSKNASQYIRDNYETLIYNLCSGKGKGRSNKDLGAAKENTWSNVTICNGENPISEICRLRRSYQQNYWDWVLRGYLRESGRDQQRCHEELRLCWKSICWKFETVHIGRSERNESRNWERILTDMTFQQNRSWLYLHFCWLTN